MSEINTEIHIGENGNWYINGEDTGKPSRGQDGLSAYQIAVSYGYKGNMFEWANDLKGDSAYHIAVKSGYTGTEEEWLRSLEGTDGQTPHIGENGRWFIGEEDTGILADAEKAVEKKIITSTDIKEDGMLMDGKTVSEALAELNTGAGFELIKTTYGIAKKYNNGLLEVEEKQTYGKVGITKEWGSGYTSNLHTLNFPNNLTFLEAPEVITSCNSSSSVAIITPASITVSGFTFYLNRFTPATLAAATVAYRAIGRWK